MCYPLTWTLRRRLQLYEALILGWRNGVILLGSMGVRVDERRWDEQRAQMLHMDGYWSIHIAWAIIVLIRQGSCGCMYTQKSFAAVSSEGH